MKPKRRGTRRPTKKARRLIKAVLFGREKPTREQEAAIDKAIDSAYRHSNPAGQEIRKARELPTGRRIKGTLQVVRRGRRRLLTFQPDRKL